MINFNQEIKGITDVIYGLSTDIHDITKLSLGMLRGDIRKQGTRNMI